MNVTEDKNKDSGPQKEGLPQRVSAERRGYAEASDCVRIIEN
jgi:hypothetical protein